MHNKNPYSNMGIINPAYEKEIARMGKMLDMARGMQPPAQPQPGQCPNCGWTPADPDRPPNFCPECGRPFDKNETNTTLSSEVQP